MQVKNAIQKVDSIHDQLDNLNVTDDLLDQEKAAQINLENALDIEENLLATKIQNQMAYWPMNGHLFSEIALHLIDL